MRTKRFSLFSAVIKSSLVFVMAISFANCSKVNFSSTTDNKTGLNTPYICDPFGGDDNTTGGLKGRLFYFQQPPANAYNTHLSDYFTNGIQHNVDIFMSHFNIPTKPWGSGFQTTSGETLKKLDGSILNEWFALKMQSQIQLSDADPEGAYQFAVLSDDGSILRMNSPTDTSVIVNNDGLTMTRFVYATQPITFTRSTRLPVQVEYFQGPKYHIAMILMWRPWNGSAADPAGGQAGNDLYFNSNVTPSVPQPAYNGLLARGWKPLSPSNFVLPNNEENPCY